MLIIERGLGDRLPDESQFTWHSYDPSDEKPEYDPVSTVRVHPWHRSNGHNYESREVFISVQCGAEETVDNWMNAIADRDEFVTGLLAVFPELQRNPDYER